MPSLTMTPSRRSVVVEDPQRLWTIRPGWGIAANLTPPELVSSYRLRRLQERIVLAVCLVALFAVYALLTQVLGLELAVDPRAFVAEAQRYAAQARAN